MALEICEKRQRVLAAEGHILVTGGPGSGKTTIALLRAASETDGLRGGQGVVFLSFSKAAIARIEEAAEEHLSKEQLRLVSMQTFHSFFWEILRCHAYLLGAPRGLTVLLPHEEKALSGGVKSDDAGWPAWEAERLRLFREEGRTAFDLFAPLTSELLQKSDRISTLVSKRYPFIVVDEAQDTSVEQWACVRRLAEQSTLLCLADLEQQIFDWLPGIGPERLAEIEQSLQPTRVDLGTENRRSGGTDILAFGDDLMAGTPRRGRGYQGVSQLGFNPRAKERDRRIRQSVGRVVSLMRNATGQGPESIAIMGASARAVALISNALNSGDKPIRHKVLFDETATLLSSRFLAFLLEPKRPAQRLRALGEAFRLLADIQRAKGSATGKKAAERFEGWATEVESGATPSRAKLFRAVQTILVSLETESFSGKPREDWTRLREALGSTGVPELESIKSNLQYLLAFNRGRLIEDGLAAAWETTHSYRDARRILDAALAQDQLIGGMELLTGIHVMTMHKAKAKQFDAVVIFSGSYASSIVWRDDPPPHRKSRRVLRVAVTRARKQVLMLTDASLRCPILGRFAL